MESTQVATKGFRTPERWNSVPVPKRVAIRAIQNVDVQESGCWISRYSTASHGYSQIGWQDGGERHIVLCHRAAWVHANGQVPLGMTLDHTCKQRRCVNPSHLRLLSNFENARRTNGEDWELGKYRNGHDDSNLVRRKSQVNSSGFRLICRTCERLANERWKARNPAKLQMIRDAYNSSRREKRASRVES